MHNKFMKVMQRFTNVASELTANTCLSIIKGPKMCSGILNKKTFKYLRIMNIVRHIVYKSVLSKFKFLASLFQFHFRLFFSLQMSEAFWKI